MKKKVKKRFFAILLLLAIVFTNVGTDFFYVQASSIEANESVQEENTETITDTETVLNMFALCPSEFIHPLTTALAFSYP
jgi:anionic cell wall polymer biosynthesis LytR-Cps2A-Psr (LCP) family protein